MQQDGSKARWLVGAGLLILMAERYFTLGDSVAAIGAALTLYGVFLIPIFQGDEEK